MVIDRRTDVLTSENIYSIASASTVVAVLWVIASELLVSGFFHFDLLRALTNSLVVVCATLLSLFVLFKSQATLARLSMPQGIMAVFLIVTLFTATSRVVVQGIGSAEVIVDIIISSALISAAVVAVIFRWSASVARQNRHQRAEANARVQALQSRIRPHFLFNSMNTIASLIAVDPERAETAVEDLSELFRAALADSAVEIDVSRELEMCRKYLDIEALRMGNRLRVDWNIDESLLSQKLPALSVQPLLENAIYHGIQPRTEGGLIEVALEQLDTQFVVRIANPSNDEEQSSHRGNRMALNNIKERLDALYGREGSLAAQRIEDKYVVELKIPLNGEDT